MNKKEFTPLTNLEHQISELDVIIMQLQQANTTNKPTNDNNKLSFITNYLITTRDEISRSVNQLPPSQENQTYIKKMLQNANALCEEHEDIVKDIIDTPKTNEEQIAEDFVENYY